jgi:MFS family permease
MSAATDPNLNPLGLFKNPAFRIVWFSGAVASTMRWLEMLAIGIFVFDLTGSPFHVALLTILRMLPLALLGVLAGAIAERIERRRIQLIGLFCMALLSWSLGLLVMRDMIELWHLALGAFLNGVFWATEMPTRRTLLGEIAGPERVGSAMGFDSITNNGTRMLGPLLGGVLLEVIGLDGTFFIGTALYALGCLAMVRLYHREQSTHAHSQKVWASIVEGLGHVRANRALVGTLVVTIIFNLWAFPFTSMIPVIGKNVLALGPSAVGLLASAEGAGAVIGGFLIAFFSQPRFYRAIYLYGTFFYLVMILMFAQSGQPIMSATLLLCVGLGGAAFSTMQSTLVFISAPPQARSRIMGILSVCIGTGPIGFFHLGLLADSFGAPTAMTIMALEGLLALIIAYFVWPEIR